MRPQFCLQIGRNRKVDIGVVTVAHAKLQIGLTWDRQIVTKTHFWKVQSRSDCNSRAKKLEQAQHHGDRSAAHWTAAAFFLNLCNTGTTKALVSAGHKRLSCVSLCYDADFAKIQRSNIRWRLVVATVDADLHLLVVIIIDVRLRHWTLLGADAVCNMDHVGRDLAGKKPTNWRPSLHYSLHAFCIWYDDEDITCAWKLPENCQFNIAHMHACIVCILPNYYFIYGVSYLSFPAFSSPAFSRPAFSCLAFSASPLKRADTRKLK